MVSIKPYEFFFFFFFLGGGRFNDENGIFSSELKKQPEIVR
jgi:hypothetical protein